MTKTKLFVDSYEAEVWIQSQEAVGWHVKLFQTMSSNRIGRVEQYTLFVVMERDRG